MVKYPHLTRINVMKLRKCKSYAIGRIAAFLAMLYACVALGVHAEANMPLIATAATMQGGIGRPRRR